LPDEIAFVNFAMGLSIVKKKMGRAWSRPMLAVRFHDRKTAGAYDRMGQRGFCPAPFHTTGHAVFRIRRLNSTGLLAS